MGDDSWDYQFPGEYGWERSEYLEELKTEESEKLLEFEEHTIKILKEREKLKKDEYPRYIHIKKLHRLLHEYDMTMATEKWQKKLDKMIKREVGKIERHSVMKQLKSGKAFWYGVSKEGHPALFCRPSRHTPERDNRQGLEAFINYLFDEGRRIVQQLRTDKICIVMDLTDFSYFFNWDRKLRTIAKERAQIEKDFEKAILADVYILNSCLIHRLWLRSTTYCLSKGRKLHFCDKDELRKFFAREELPEEHGGLNSQPFEGEKEYDFFLRAREGEEIKEEEGKSEKERSSGSREMVRSELSGTSDLVDDKEGAEEGKEGRSKEGGPSEIGDIELSEISHRSDGKDEGERLFRAGDNNPAEEDQSDDDSFSGNSSFPEEE